MKKLLFSKVFVERERLCKDKRGFGGALAAFFVFMATMLLGLWLCSCSMPKYYVFEHSDVFEFDMDNLAVYDADRNVGSYVVLDTLKVWNDNIFHTIGFRYDTIEISFEGILIEELEQGEAAYVDEGRVLYD